MSETAQSMWLDFAKSVVPEEADDLQRAEMRRCFYAGALSVLGETRLNATPSWRRLHAEVTDWLRADVNQRLAAAQTHDLAGLYRQPEGGEDCRTARLPYHLAVTRCLSHERVELWINGVPYAIEDERAERIGRALIAAAKQGRR